MAFASKRTFLLLHNRVIHHAEWDSKKEKELLLETSIKEEEEKATL